MPNGLKCFWAAITGKRLTISFSAEQNGFAHENPSIVVIDCHPLSRSSLARILRSEFQDYTILEVETAHRLESIITKHIGLVALNIGSSAMTDDGVLHCLAHLRRSLAEAPVMLLTQLDEATISDAMISDVTRYGVRGFITESASVEIALAAFRLVMAGGVYFPRMVLVGSAGSMSISSESIVALQPALTCNGETHDLPAIGTRTNVAFTERERQVLAALLRGLSNKIIASELNLSQNTVKSHISHIMRKLHATNRTEVVVFSRNSEHSTNGEVPGSIPDA
ncbi:response regulator transcription factor [Aminobacter sp. HY435]|uniref:response regulator transcription factor n=1 Tax=Aminobacter sp. HY435 TaxID=2970917 RepID=UPI0022B97C48|nr:response regulator transcription factor [Aminobacter sp. HY435]